jgi:Rod binding domain-containing protein
MEPVKLPLTDRTPPAVPTEGSSKISPVALESRKVQTAKDFESLLIGKLVDSMKDTVGDSGLLEDEGAEQTQALFWMNLSTAISDQGGVGLWKDIYKSIYGKAPAQDTASTAGRHAYLDKTI